MLLQFGYHALFLGVIGALIVDQTLAEEFRLLNNELVSPICPQEKVNHLIQHLVHTFGVHTLTGVDHEVIAPLGDPHCGTVALVHKLLEGLHPALLELIVACK